LSFRLEEVWFPGEVCGCPHLWEGRLYNRPATPSRFSLKLALASLDRLLAEPDGLACFPHFIAALPLKEALILGRRQLDFWSEFLRRPEAAPRPVESRAERLDRLADQLWLADPLLAPLRALPPAEIGRERFFLRNNINGLLENLEDAGADISGATVGPKDH
jgi:hypothetical protein